MTKTTDLHVPEIGESVSEVEIGAWLVQVGEFVERDAGVVVLETDKATVELPAPFDGVLTEALAETGEMRNVGDLIARMEEGGAPEKSSASTKKTKAKKAAPAKAKAEAKAVETEPAADDAGDARVMPAAARLLAENDLAASDVEATGPGGRLLKEDVQKHIAAQSTVAASGGQSPAKSAPAKSAPASGARVAATGARGERVEPMSRLRRTIAKRLVEAQQTAALLTTFNEIDMTAVKSLRASYKQDFADRYGVKLGFMSFFVKAVVDALKATPSLNAQVRDDSIVYHDYQDIGIAVGSGRGLVVPILRDADHLSFADIEQRIGDFGARAQAGTLTPDELTGGTFTISNGGVYGSLLSTPIVNPPQSGVLGLHGIQDRPIGRDGEIVLAPMMYVALTYDHRIVDGREAVTFLRRVKDAIETPSRMLLEI